MPTPVGPAPRDPNDPDLWDWDDPWREEAADPRRRPGLWWTIVVFLVVIGMVLLVVLSVV